MCLLWQQGSCDRPVCAFRHSKLNRQRSSIPCYWENQPTGCLKTHCPFKHFKPRPFAPTVVDRIQICKDIGEWVSFRLLLSDFFVPLCVASTEKLSGIKIETVEELKMKKEQQQQQILSSPSTAGANTTKGSPLVSEQPTVQQAKPSTISPPPPRPTVPTIVKPTIQLSALHLQKKSGIVCPKN